MKPEHLRNSRRPSIDEAYQLVVRVFSVLIICAGLAIVGVTVARGGGPLSVGLLFGLVFVAIGCGRLYLSTRS